MKRGPVFEVLLNRAGRWFVHEVAGNGEIVSVSQAYSTKWSATRAAKRKAAATSGARWRVRTS